MILKCVIMRVMKECTMCKQSKALSEFNKNICRKDGLQNKCRDCSRKHSKEYYKDHKDVMRPMIVAASKLRQEIAYDWVVDYFGEHPCVDCGCVDIRVLEFDHVTGTKRYGVGYMLKQGHSLDAIKEEVAKCEVRCRNCHQIKTFERMGGTWHDKFINASVV
jgi:hypothetical protein